jgi:hypothetical protein
MDENREKFGKNKKTDILIMSSKDEIIKCVGGKTLIEKSLLMQGFFCIMTDWLFASSHETLQVYRYLYRDQTPLPKYWKFENELLHKMCGLKDKLPIAPFGSKEPAEYNEKEMEIKKNQTWMRSDKKMVVIEDI